MQPAIPGRLEARRDQAFGAPARDAGRDLVDAAIHLAHELGFQRAQAVGLEPQRPVVRRVTAAGPLVETDAREQQVAVDDERQGLLHTPGSRPPDRRPVATA